MPKVAQLPMSNGAPHENGAEARHAPKFQHRFYAFLSYSHKDEALADWLHHELEQFHVPRWLAGKLTAAGVIPKRLAPVFRDRHELAAADDLGAEIKAALNASQFLVVLCSPTAAKSRWVNAEIEAFKRTRPEGCVLAAIASGEPFASEMPGREEEECFPPALRKRFSRGRSSGKRAEPLAADFRDQGEGKRLAFLKLVAGMLGVGLDDLVRRETTRRQRRMGYVAAASLAGMAITSTLAVVAIQSRDAARDQRREAEGLIGFMLGDLRDKLEPIGKLDALDGVGSRVLAYYKKVGTADLSDAALSQRSKALSLMAEVANLRGDSDGALRLYQEASAGTEEAVRRAPEDPQRLFDHAQNVFYVAEIFRQRGDTASAESGMRKYQELATHMVALGPDNMKWRMEVQYADTNLGIVLYMQRRFAEAADQFEQALRMIEAISTADPNSDEYHKSLSLSLAWLADARVAEGQLTTAIAIRERQIALLNGLVAQRGGNVAFREMLIPAERGLGRLFASIGQRDLALTHLQTAVAIADRLVPIEQNNTRWLNYSYEARLDLADTLLSAGQIAAATAQANAACDTVRTLLAQDSHYPYWLAGRRDCLLLRARLSLAANAPRDALASAEEAVAAAKSIKGSDRGADAYGLAKANRILGDIYRASGDSVAARNGWAAALAAIPKLVGERPAEAGERLLILERLGRQDEARPIAAKLKTIGYRSAEL